MQAPAPPHRCVAVQDVPTSSLHIAADGPQDAQATLLASGGTWSSIPAPIPSAEAPPVVEEALRSSSQQLDPQHREAWETRFGADFSTVRLHVGESARRSLDAVRALAFSVGEDVVTGDLSLGTSGGSRVLGHELAHVVQQRAGGVPMVMRHPDDRQAGSPGSATGPPSPLGASEATRSRLEQIIRTGGPLPGGTRVIGAAIVEVEGYAGPRELRAVSSSQTDDLGHGAAVPHAQTPTDRTLSAARSIGGASVRREFPFSHINDAEIKLFEEISRHMPPNARGRISFLTMRSRLNGTVLEPIPACSSCTNATFQVAGTFRGVEVASYAAVHPTGSADLRPSSTAPGTGQAPPAPGRTQSRPGPPAPARTSPPQSGAGVRAEVGTPDMRGTTVSGPSPRGTAALQGAALALSGVNFVLNVINDDIQRERVQQALGQLEPDIRRRRQRNPELGILVIIHFRQVQGPPESAIQPGPEFRFIDTGTGRTRDEAFEDWRSTPAIREALPLNVREFKQEVWLPPSVTPSVRSIRAPWPRAALATFREGTAQLQDVEWGGVTGFDDEGSSPLDVPEGLRPRFLVLQVPRTLTFFNGSVPVKVDIPIRTVPAAAGGSIPVVDLDPWVPFANVRAACVFPADDATQDLFGTARATKDNLNQLGIYPNFSRARWVRPEHVRVLPKA